MSGNLSFGVDSESGLVVEYREVIHHLTARQREMYNNMARAWQEVLKNFTRALDITNSSRVSRRYVVNQFRAEHQRCFRNLIKDFKVPTVIREIENELSAKQSVVVSITGTGEAPTKKQMMRASDEEEAIDNLDFSPRNEMVCGQTGAGFWAHSSNWTSCAAHLSNSNLSAVSQVKPEAKLIQTSVAKSESNQTVMPVASQTVSAQTPPTTTTRTKPNVKTSKPETSA